MEESGDRNRGHVKTEINWDKLNVSKFYVVGAGIFTGITVALYPISVIKTRLQVASKDVADRSAYSVVKGILKADGVPGLYRGFGTVITGAVPARIIFLTALETTKVATFQMVEPFKLSEPTKAAIANGIAGMAASLCSQSVFVPIDVVSQRLMVQGYSGHTKYNGGLDVARKIIKADGFRGLYRGFGLSIMTYSPSSAVWWASYGSSQRLIWRYLGHGTGSQGAAPSQGTVILVQAAGGIAAGATASCITTPLDTIKTRLQVLGHENKSTAKQVVRRLIKEDGWKGFYRGLGPRFFSTSAWGTSMILAYEYLTGSYGECKLLDVCANDGDCGAGLYYFSCHQGFLGSRGVRSTISNQFQLLNGVRGLMLYTYDFKGDIWMCHASKESASLHCICKCSYLYVESTPQYTKYEGFVIRIPKGWRIYVYTRETNYDPCLYSEPLTFNPWRWMDKSIEFQKN